MEAPWPHGGLWGLALLPPTLLLAALCARCWRPRGRAAHTWGWGGRGWGCPTASGPSPSSDPPGGFEVRSRPPAPPQPPLHPQQPLPPWEPPAGPVLTLPSPQSRRVSVAPPEPGPRDPPTPPEGDDDYSNKPYDTGYVEVLPEPPAQDGTPGGGGSGATEAPGEEYENVPDGARSSLGDSLEYINLPPPGSSPRDASESEDCGPDYENL